MHLRTVDICHYAWTTAYIYIWRERERERDYIYIYIYMRRRPGRSGPRCCYRCCCRCMLFHDSIYIYVYMYVFLYYLSAEKHQFIPNIYSFSRKDIICFENITFRSKIWAFRETTNLSLRKQDLFIQDVAKLTLKRNLTTFVKCFGGKHSNK